MPPETHPESLGKAGRTAIAYEIVVRGEVTERFIEPLEGVVVESAGEESILRVEVIDQPKLRSILDWLSDHGIDLVSVRPTNGSPPA